MKARAAAALITILAGLPAAAIAAEPPAADGFPGASLHEIADFCQAKAIASDDRCTVTWCGASFEKAYSAECRSYCLELTSDDALRCIPEAARSLRARFLTPPNVDAAGYCGAIYDEVRKTWVAKGIDPAEARRRFDRSVAACNARVTARAATPRPEGK